ncbi:hypothetical protein STRTUCAR8_03163 [Streptomyces turgidiscabies Car8]|uniref:Glycosyl hydrolase, family 43 n=1 Tax=Streptomyces turgidiscabies (strain Car8) TaxID=698760 RepID=L7EUN0_STRT8|nr:hypothetical protein STRTUCAR8_03163 [Streptomyces turgidiscabies Car8]GAQ74739.1 arabinoxylan arabinofuranohydrolase precursor [Streptomyces turgidiscabies]
MWSSADMVNWTDHGSPLSLATFSWAPKDAWAGQAVQRNGRFYWYVPVTNRATGRMAIGVAVSDSPTGPFRDALGHPLVENGEFDPTVFIDYDGQAYLYWGHPNLWYVRLNTDMTSYSGSPTRIPLTTAGFGTRIGDANRPPLFEEGPWVYKRGGLHYLVFAAKWHRLYEPTPVHAAAGVDDGDQQVDRFGTHPVRAEAERGDGRGGRRVVRILADARHQQVPRYPKPMAAGGGEDVVTGVGVDADDNVRSWIAVQQAADRLLFRREVVGQGGALLDECGHVASVAPGPVGVFDQARVLVVVQGQGEPDPPAAGLREMVEEYAVMVRPSTPVAPRARARAVLAGA